MKKKKIKKKKVIKINGKTNNTFILFILLFLIDIYFDYILKLLIFLLLFINLIINIISVLNIFYLENKLNYL